MKKINFYLFILIVQFTQNCFSQNGSQFENGFDTGYKETLRDAGIIGNYPEYADSRMCESKNTYVNDSKANEKIYADGYRCGVSQASKAIIKINKSINNKEKQYDNSSLKVIQKNIDDLKRKISNGLAPQQENAINSQILALEQQKSNLIISAKNRQVDGYSNSQQRSLDENKSIQTNNYNQGVLNQLNQNQIQSQNNFKNTIENLTNGLQSFSQQMIQGAQNRAIDAFNQRLNMESSYSQTNAKQINKVVTYYNSLPKDKFNKVVNGIFEASLFAPQTYSFSKGDNYPTYIPCLVEVEQGKLTHLYPYGKKELELDYPQKFPDNSYFLDGVVVYSDYETLKNISVLLIEPYALQPKNHNIVEGEIGYITVWSNNKDDEGKSIFIREVDNKGQTILREVATKIIYAKNEKSLILPSENTITVSSGNVVHIIAGETRNTPIGLITLYPELDNYKSTIKPIEKKENKLIKIKKYR